MTELELLQLDAAARREAEQLLRRLAKGDAIAAVTTRSLPALPDTPTLQFDAARKPRARSTSWKQRAWAGVASAVVVLGLAGWVVFRPAVTAGHDSLAGGARQDSGRAVLSPVVAATARL